MTTKYVQISGLICADKRFDVHLSDLMSVSFERLLGKPMSNRRLFRLKPDYCRDVRRVNISDLIVTISDLMKV